MLEIPYDPDFKKYAPDGWQRVPRALRDAIIQSKFRPAKERIYFYCFQVWDDKRGEHGFLGPNVPIRQADLVAVLGIDDGRVSRAVRELEDEGLIEIGPEKRIYPITQPRPLRMKNGDESAEGAVAKFWEQHDSEKYQKFVAWRAESKYWKAEIRKAKKDVAKMRAQSGPVSGPSENAAGPPPHPLSIKRESPELDGSAKPAEPKSPPAPVSQIQTQAIAAIPNKDRFEEIMFSFGVLGRGSSNASRKRECELLWCKLSMEERLAAHAHVDASLAEWRTRDKDMIPFAWNYLRKKAWNDGTPRLLPKERPKTKTELANEEFERRMNAKHKGAGV